MVLPPGAYGAIADRRLLRWLSRGAVTFRPSAEEALNRVLRYLGQPVPSGGLAALRFWGQAGERPGAWIAAADPVHLETRLRELRVRAICPGEIDLRDHDALIESLQAAIGGEEHAFVRLDNASYVRAREAFAAPDVSAFIADGAVPDRFLPSGPLAGGFHRLQSEVQMLLHEHEVNRRRADRGAPIINSLWIWGGGEAPERREADLPPLFSADPLFAGYWASAGKASASWRGDIAECLSGDGFVAVMPELPRASSADTLQFLLSNLKRHFDGGQLRKLALFFRDGLTVELSWRNRFRIWRGIASSLEATS